MKILVKNLLQCLFLLVFFVDCSPLLGQEKGAIVECRLEYTDTIKAGDSLKISVILDIAPGFYIYAPTEMNQLQSLQIMKLLFTSPVTGIKKAGELMMPRYSVKEGYQIYEGKEVRVMQCFKTGKEIKPGVYTLKIRLVTQACNERMCFPPVAEIRDAVINVVPG